MTHRQPLHVQGTRALAVVGAVFGGLLACSAPAREIGSAPPASASSDPVDVVVVPVPSAVAVASAPSAAPPPAVSVSTPAPASAEVEPPAAPGSDRRSAALSPEKARGQCSGWTTLQTKGGEVNCYPYRCRAGKCLLSCTKREDCAGSLGPADMAEHGWPLDCATSSATCYPLSPEHVGR